MSYRDTFNHLGYPRRTTFTVADRVVFVLFALTVIGLLSGWPV